MPTETKHSVDGLNHWPWQKTKFMQQEMKLKCLLERGAQMERAIWKNERKLKRHGGQTEMPNIQKRQPGKHGAGETDPSVLRDLRRSHDFSHEGLDRSNSAKFLSRLLLWSRPPRTKTPSKELPARRSHGSKTITRLLLCHTKWTLAPRASASWRFLNLKWFM